MKNVILFALVSMSFASAQAAERLCPKYDCTADSNFNGGHRTPVTASGYADVLEAARSKALIYCHRDGGLRCQIVYCEKFHGPVIPLFKCQDQWK